MDSKDKSKQFLKQYVKSEKVSPSIKSENIDSSVSENFLNIINSSSDTFNKERFIQVIREAIEENVADKKEMLVNITTLNCKIQFLEELIYRELKDNREEIGKLYVKIDTLEETTYRTIGSKEDSSISKIDVESANKGLIHKFISNIIESPLTTTLVISGITVILSIVVGLISAYIEEHTGKEIIIPKINITEP